uniref:DUF19 domain-containing protein n=1 Tax=Echinococcus granulosus TaxID=6210 RepID=A0A068WYM5_ECHGR|nr:hypothetical protein EgrG_000918400 [Echinococcus granulosus]
MTRNCRDFNESDAITIHKLSYDSFLNCILKTDGGVDECSIYLQHMKAGLLFLRRNYGDCSDAIEMACSVPFWL